MPGGQGLIKTAERAIETMNDQGKKLFATVPFGFDKKAVIAYIGQLNDAYEKEIAKKEQEIERLKQELQEKE